MVTAKERAEIIREHFSKMGKSGFGQAKVRGGPDYYSQLGKIGARRRAEKAASGGGKIVREDMGFGGEY